MSRWNMRRLEIMSRTNGFRCDWRALLIGSALLLVAGCGQKGPLYMPDKGGEVVTRPAGQTQSTQSPETAPQPATQPADSTATKPESDKKEDEKKQTPPPQ
jgi:predicted small lipoprotein YifL